MKNTKEIKRNLAEALFPSLFLSFTFFVFGPLEIYLTNLSSLWFTLKMFLPGCLLIFLISLALFTFVIWISRNNPVVTGIVFGVALALYIQGNWMFVSYGQMDGTAIDWAGYGAWPYINGAIWIALILASVILAVRFKDKPIYQKAVRYISLGLVAIQCLTLATLLFTTDLSQFKRNYYVARDEQMLDLSTQHNVIVMLFDGYQTSYFQQVLQDIPEAEDVFDGFVFFDNAVGTSLYSQEGSATIFTGKQLEQTGISYRENVDDVYTRSEFFPALSREGYDARYYEVTENVSSEAAPVIKNIVIEEPEGVSAAEVVKTMGQITAFRYMPHILKPYFWFSYTDIEDVKPADEFGANDSLFNQEILAGKLRASMDENVYRVYYFKGVHPPYDLDENGDHIQYEGETYILEDVVDIHDNEKMYRQAKGSVRIMMNFIQALKEAGVYDNTDIVITADHGWQNRYNPLLLIKRQHTTGKLEVSHAPVSYIEDFEPTILSMIDPSYAGKKTVFDYREGEERRRPFYLYDFNSDRSYNEIRVFSTYSSEIPVEENFLQELDDEQIKYQLGDEVLFTEEGGGVNYFRRGISYVRTDYPWTLGKDGVMYLNIGEVPGDLTGTFRFAMIHGASQRLIIKSNGQVLYDQEVSSADKAAIFTVPAECIQDGKLTLELEYPEAYSPKSAGENTDGRVLAFAFSSIRFGQPDKYQLGDRILFTEEGGGVNCFRGGISYVETNFAWSLGKQAHMYLDLSSNDLSDRVELEGHIRLADVFNGSQRVTIKAKDQILYDDVVTLDMNTIEFKIPIECLNGDALELELDYPDACSPASLGKTDQRVLAVGFREIWFE